MIRHASTVQTFRNAVESQSGVYDMRHGLLRSAYLLMGQICGAQYRYDYALFVVREAAS